MKLAKVNVVVFILSLLSLPSFAASKTGDEHQAVIDTAYKYFNGVANGDKVLMSEAFDMDYGHMKMVATDKDSGKEIIRVVPFETFAGYFKAATKEKWQANILSVDIVDSKMAMVKLNFHTPKTHYIDYLVMYKRNQQWKIINKTFVANKKP